MTITHHGALLALVFSTACDITAGGQSPPDADPSTPGDEPAMPDAMPGTDDASDDGGDGDDGDGDETPVTCPDSYAITIPSSTSRYRIAIGRAPFADHHAGCSEEPAATHLIAIDDVAELAEIFAQVPPSAGPLYVGAVQMPGELGTADGWRTFTGGALPAGLWWFDQPNDGDFWESFDEQRAAVDVTGKLHDVSGAAAFAAICECDLQPVAPVVVTALAFD